MIYDLRFLICVGLALTSCVKPEPVNSTGGSSEFIDVRHVADNSHGMLFSPASVAWLADKMKQQ